jgi:pimeloyl-ACP methyl ester carboxylesterase
MSLPGRFVPTSTGRVFVHTAGSENAPPLVLLHGYLMSHWYFRALLPELARDHRVFAVDLPGYGESDNPDPARYRYDSAAYAGTVDEVMAKLGIGPARVIGHSMGGGAALTLAARFPERVERLVLVSAAVFPLAVTGVAKLLLNPTVGPFLWKLFTKGEMRRQMLAEHFKDSRPVTDEFVDYVWERLNRAGGREAAYAAAVALGSLRANTSDPGRVRAPTLLVWPDYDRVVPLESHGKRLERAIAGAQLRVVPDSGHNVHLERPAEFLRQLMPFLADTTLQPVAETPVPAPRAHAVTP